MSTNFHVLNSLESLKGIPVIRTFDKRGGIPSLQITTTEVRNIYIVYQQMIRVMLVKLLLVLIALIENTSWKVLAYGIYARVVDVSEIERVSAANE